MSGETVEWLNQNTLKGFTEKTGNAWHYLPGNDNHFPGAIPVEVVKRRLFSWEAVSGPVETTIAGRKYVDTDRQVIARPDTGAVLGVFKSSYVIHDYKEWLINNVSKLLDAELAIGSAGLLKQGAVAWVQIEMAETVKHASGVEFRPYLTATTSLDGSLATTYVSGNNLVVCDNTLSAALSSSDALKHKTKHSRHSLPKLGQVREALDLIVATGDDFSAALDELTNAPVSDARFEQFLNVINPLEGKGGRGLTMAENKNDALWGLWTSDPRVAPWKNTEFGVVQAVNTFQQHESILRGELNRVERNALDFLKSDRNGLSNVDRLDLGTLAALATV